MTACPLCRFPLLQPVGASDLEAPAVLQPASASSEDASAAGPVEGAPCDLPAEQSVELQINNAGPDCGAADGAAGDVAARQHKDFPSSTQAG